MVESRCFRQGHHTCVRDATEASNASRTCRTINKRMYLVAGEHFGPKNGRERERKRERLSVESPSKASFFDTTKTSHSSNLSLEPISNTHSERCTARADRASQSNSSNASEGRSCRSQVKNPDYDACFLTLVRQLCRHRLLLEYR